MYQLKGLIWKAYKVRLRSPLTTAMDVGGPVAIMCLYLIIKLLLGSIPAELDPEISNATNIFTNPNIKPLDPPNDLKRHLCNRVLFYSAIESSVKNILGARCGIQLVTVSSRDELMARLRTSLEAREAFSKPGTDLNKPISKSTNSDGCFTLSGASEPSYQAGIVQIDRIHFEIHTTDTANNPVSFMPYTQSSSYNELVFPHGDLNSGLYLLTKCLNEINHQNLYDQMTGRQDKPSNSSQVPSATNAGFKWRLLAYPVITSATIMPVLFIAFNLIAAFCVGIGVISRVADDNETGLHHYIRTTGIPVGVYWLSQLIMIFIHVAVQSLILAAILAIPVKTEKLLDPIYEASLSLRWLLLFSYTFSISSHAMFFSSLFEKTPQALLATCFLAISYAVYPMTLQVRWTPYGFGAYNYIYTIMLFNPCSCYEALLAVLFAVRTQTNEPIRWSHFYMRSLDIGVSEWSMLELWCLLMGQAVAWFLLLVLKDQITYGPSITKAPLGALLALARECCFCSSFGLPAGKSGSNLSSQMSKSTNGPKSLKSAVSRRDPNRICCSLRRVCVTGPQILMAYTTGDPLKIKPAQYGSEFKSALPESSHVSKTHQYLVNRSRRPSSAQYREGNRMEEPIFLDESLQQHIAWQKSSIAYNNLNLDFRFNQVSFILGQTDLKELFFATLLGLRTMSSGYIEIDETRYTPSSMHLARKNIGYLGERDIFLNEMTIFENLQFFGSLRDSSYTQFDSESSFLLSLLHLTSRKNFAPQVLTNRSARKLALAVASVGHTKLLLLVEPTLNLRWRPRCHVLNLLKKYKAIRSIVVDTSDVDEATAFGDRLVLLKNGRADLDGTPSHLSKKLSCGHLLIFEPTTGDRKNISAESVKALEALTGEVFKQDKLARLDVTRRSVYQDPTGSKISGVNTATPDKVSSKKSAIAAMDKHKSRESASVVSKVDVEKLHKPTVILKIQHSAHSNEGLCTLLKMFAQHNIHGFRLAELSYESLEDVIVLRMSKASYPDLPPDLLLSLQHRTLVKRTASDQPQVSVRRLPSETYEPRLNGSMFGANVKAILKDRLTARREVLITLSCSLIAIAFVGIALLALKISLRPQSVPSGGRATVAQANGGSHVHGEVALEHSYIDALYRTRIAFYVIDRKGSNAASYLDQWPLNKEFTGLIPQNRTTSDTEFVANIIDSHKDLPSSLIIYDPDTKEVTITYDRNLPHAMMASVTAFINYGPGGSKARGLAENGIKITQYNYEQPWHEIIQGRSSRRLFYGLGFSIAEGIALGVGVLAPLRHRSEAKEVKVRSMYWFAMFLFDISIAFIQVVGYIVLLAIIEGTMSSTFVLCCLLVLLLYKLASLPLVYLTSLVAENALNGFLFLMMSTITIAWVFSIHLRTFVEYTLFNEGYPYLIANWVILLTPIGSVIDALTEISQTNRIDVLCSKVPAYTATQNIVDLDRPHVNQLIETQLEKVQECLANGKSGIAFDIWHRKTFGIVWDIYLMIMFGVICWTFLLFSDRVFGIIVKKFSSYRTSQDPLKTIIRSPETSLYKWDREKDRLISEYLRCTNEARYVKQMAANCIYLRIWLKPMSDQTSIDKQLPHILEPLVMMGQPKTEIQVELKTTLQVFVRLGNDSSRCKIDKIQLINAYSKYVKEHDDRLVKFAVIDWTRETLYKILLHGYYNTKSTTVV